MTREMLAFGLAAGLALAVPAARAESSHRLGVGGHYWATVDNIDIDNIDRNGLSWLASYQYWPGWVGVEADVEWFQKGFAGTGVDMYQPQAYLLLGKTLYGAAGIGGYYSDGTLAGNPFYAFRVGLNVEALPHIYLDLNANYRFEDWSKLNASDVKSDTITLGAAVRLGF